jgi:site-specific DNA-methyltransferase (adenine-specific)
MDEILRGDCIELLKEIGDSTVDLVLSDLPYGVTQNAWDKEIPMSPLWGHFRRILKPKGVIALTAQGMFTAKLMIAAPDLWRYNLIWKKNKPRGFLNANRQPLRIHEDVAIFYKKQPRYFPQKTKGHSPVHSYTKHSSDGSNYGATKLGVSGGGSTERYPNSIISIPVVNGTDCEHPTQKPVALGEWLIKTYTQPGDLVVDPACGSGTFCLAAKRLDRRFFGFEISHDYCELARKRLT